MTAIFSMVRGSGARRALPWLALSALLVLGAGCRKAARFGGVGRTGSKARFALGGDHLYTLGRDRITVFSLAEPAAPRPVATQAVEFEAETLFLHDSLLYVGTRRGMWIYDVSRPERPRRLGGHQHLYACDPVVVDGARAYVTLSTGAGCRRGVNELRIYDVTDPRYPQLRRTVPMHRPGGLGVDRGFLFVTNGRLGVDVFDVRAPLAPRRVARLETLQGYDVIPNDGVLVVSAEDGIYQFDYRRWPIRQVSRIPIASGHALRPEQWRRVRVAGGLPFFSMACR